MFVLLLRMAQALLSEISSCVVHIMSLGVSPGNRVALETGESESF
jgi:hypothetical protein